MSINQDIDSSLLTVTDTERQEAISNLIQKLVKKKDPDLDLWTYNKDSTKKQEEVEFYNYMLHLEKYKFAYYSVRLSADKKALIKK